MQFRWTPYNHSAVRRITPSFVYGDMGVWTSVSPLICFAIIEWHAPDRVLPQFGGAQHIARHAINIDRLHGSDGRGVQGRVRWWPDHFQVYHELWDHRIQRCIEVNSVGDTRPSREYFQWYSAFAHRFLAGVPLDRAVVDLPGDVPATAPAAPLITYPPDIPDDRGAARRLRVGTRASRRQYPGDADDDIDAEEEAQDYDYYDDADDDDGHHDTAHTQGGASHQTMHHPGSSFQPSTSHQPIHAPGSSSFQPSSSDQHMHGLGSSFMPYSSHQPTEAMHDMSFPSVSTPDLLNFLSFTHDDGYSDFSQPMGSPIISAPVSTPECYRPQMPAFDQLGGTPVSAFSHYTPQQDATQGGDDQQDATQTGDDQQLPDQGRPARAVRARLCHSGCELPAPRRN